MVPVDTMLRPDLVAAGDAAAELAAAGFDGAFTAEGSNDPFLPLALAARDAPIDVYTNLAIAFPRNPLHLAYQSFDLQRLSQGRFALGLGTQIRAHIERRFGVAWDRPVRQMEELIRAVRAIFDRWQHGTELSFEGEYYHHTMMPPTFDPGPLDVGPPPVLVGAVGPAMTRMAARTADGLLVHPMNSRPFLESHTLPLVAEGRAAAELEGSDFRIVCGALVGPYRDEPEQKRITGGLRQLLGFYGSTPAYRPVLEQHGWGEMQPVLREMTKHGRWQDTASLIDDEVLATLAVVGEPDEVADELHRRYDGIVDRLALFGSGDLAALGEVLERYRGGVSSAREPGLEHG